MSHYTCNKCGQRYDECVCPKATPKFDSSKDALGKVVEERKRQDIQWGGPDHDDTHSDKDWVAFIQKQLDNARWVEDSIHPYHRLYKERLIKIAALAIAAYESLERKNG